MKVVLPAVFGVLLCSALPASAASLCNCCGGGTAATCSTACEQVKPPEGQCVSTVDFSGSVTIGPGKNPLYEMSLQNLFVGPATKPQLESLRLLLEQSRLGAEVDRKMALHDFAGGKIDKVAADSAAKRYDDAMVNYFLGVHAYREALAR
jgi:hypothetical protein